MLECANMDKMYKVKIGAIVKIVPAGSLVWYELSGANILGEVKNDKANTKKNATK